MRSSLHSRTAPTAKKKRHLKGRIRRKATAAPSTDSTTRRCVDIGAVELIVDRDTFSVRYRGLECFLGFTMDFLLLERFQRSRGIYLSIRTLMQDVWPLGKVIDDATVQKTVSNLRKKLKAKELSDKIVIDGSQRGHYRLVLR
jgi:DNA-binding response OmpR family regulator